VLTLYAVVLIFLKQLLYCVSDLDAETTKNQQWVDDNFCRLSTTVTTHDQSMLLILVLMIVLLKIKM